MRYLEMMISHLLTEKAISRDGGGGINLDFVYIYTQDIGENPYPSRRQNY